jgi:hypothetical protein
LILRQLVQCGCQNTLIGSLMRRSIAPPFGLPDRAHAEPLEDARDRPPAAAKLLREYLRRAATAFRPPEDEKLLEGMTAEMS